MSYSDGPILGDCWIDEVGRHWFCKGVELACDGDMIHTLFMVRYIDEGFILVSILRFLETHPAATLYMREGIHPGTSVPGFSNE